VTNFSTKRCLLPEKLRRPLASFIFAHYVNPMRTTFSFSSSGRLIFGNHSLDQLPQTLQFLGVKRPFLVTDPILVKVGLAEKLLAKVPGIPMFSDIGPEPSLAMITNAYNAALPHKPDAVIGLGGGSNMDAAKLVSILLTHGGHPKDYVGEEKVPGPVIPNIAIPTTAGTGSEVSLAAVFTDTDAGIKVSTLSEYLRPKIAIVDPLLTLSCPPKVSADSGMDALVHAIEAFTAIDYQKFPVPDGAVSVYQGKNPLADSMAEQAIKLVAKHLVQAVNHGDDLLAREGMALAATLAGLAFSNAAVALVHAMEYPVGAAVHCSHGEGNALLLPHVMRFNKPARLEEFATIATWLGEDVSGLSLEEAAERAIIVVDRLREAVKIPARLRDIKVIPEQIPQFAKKAITITRLMRVNPIYPTESDIEKIYQAAY